MIAEKSPHLACGIDPGRDKFGVALVEGSTLIFSAVLPTDRLDVLLEALASGSWKTMSDWQKEGNAPDRIPDLVCLGNGTYAQIFEKKLMEKSVNYCMIDETGTTLEGRKLYWRLHPPGGLWRLVPLSLRTPPRPVDDLAAWVIATKAVKDDYKFQ